MLTIANRSITFYLCSALFTFSGIIQAMEPEQNLSKIPLNDHFIGMSQCGPNSLLVYGENRNSTGYLNLYDFSGIQKKSFNLNGYIVGKIFPLNDSEVMLIYLDKKMIQKLDHTTGKICDMYCIPPYDTSEPLSWYFMLPNDRVVFGYLNNYIKVCNSSTGAIIKEFHLDPYSDYQTTDGKNRIFQITYGQIQKLLIWDLEQGACIKEIEILQKSDERYVSSLCYLDTEHIVFGCSDGFVLVWDLKTGEKVKEIKAHSELIKSIINIGKGYFVTGSYDSHVKTWSTSSDECLRDFEGHLTDEKEGIISLIQLSGDQIASASPSTIQISKALIAKNTEAT